MIHNDIQSQLQLLIKTSAPPLIEVAQSALETPEWTPGQRLPAHVLASLPNGRFEVRVGDQILDLNLPRNTQAGDTLELTYLSSSPRVTFALTRDLANTLPANTPVSLSDTAKFIGSLLQKGGEAGQAAQIGKAIPVMTAPPSDTAVLAQSLRQAVSQSGLFYESHQVQWLSGERNLDSLLQEPQGRLSPLLDQGDAQKSAAVDPKQVLANKPAEMGALAAGALNAEAAKSEPVHPQSLQIVQQQLQTLDSRQIVWQGQVWPGQEMKWEIEEDASRRQESEQEAAHWHTRLNLQLPSLGGVSAKLAFVNGSIQLDIAADNAASVERLRRAQASLAERFEASGLALTGVNIRHE
ncbi:MAG TPA: flagellar hook-length control protein FliK [Methylophilaceae bacterium]|jgi:hypothetical protein|nr:flagellar hook-length control protein FliK [Methylophilaceae bacterium]